MNTSRNSAFVSSQFDRRRRIVEENRKIPRQQSQMMQSPVSRRYITAEPLV